MSDISTLILNEIEVALERLSKKGIGFIHSESTDSLKYQIDNRVFNITVEEPDSMDEIER